jgi:hypothetical protein
MLVLGIFFFIPLFYFFYYFYVTFEEVKKYRRQGVGGVAGLLLCFVIVGSFLLPAYVGRMFKEDGEHPQISGWAGLWQLIPLVGGFIYFAKLQGALNNFWEMKQRGAPAAAAPPQPA